MSQQKKKPFWLIYFLGFLWTLAMALPLYAQSSLLEELVGIGNVGLVLAGSTSLLLLLLTMYPFVLKRFHNYYTTLLSVGLNMAAVGGFVFAQGLWKLPFYMLISSTLVLLVVNLDIFLERFSNDKSTGQIRTTLLTIMNIAILISPMLMGALVGANNNYDLVYLIGGIAMFPTLPLLLFHKKSLDDPKTQYRQRSAFMLRMLLKKYPNIGRILSTEFALRFFYGTMVLYVPIYLHEHVGFSWATMGGMFTVMLLPFVLLQIPAGRLADRYIGEKEMILMGLIVMIVFSTIVVFLDSSSVIVWTAVLFMTRVGAALLEAMNETHFFKMVDKKDMDLIDLFRDMRPIGWLSASLVSFVLLKWFTIPVVILCMVLVLIMAQWPALRLKDSR